MTTEFVAKEQGLSMSSDVGDDTTKSLDRQTDESLRVLQRRLLLNPITVGWVSRTSSRVHLRRPAPQGAQGTESCQFFIKIIFTIRPRKMEVKKRKNDVPREKRWKRQQPKTGDREKEVAGGENSSRCPYYSYPLGETPHFIMMLESASTSSSTNQPVT